MLSVCIAGCDNGSILRGGEPRASFTGNKIFSSVSLCSLCVSVVKNSEERVHHKTRRSTVAQRKKTGDLIIFSRGHEE